ncbi:RING finger protein 17 [Cynoglossus semilaevis]|uniref:RING finger protein 17 n=1 Tax=Cynoglossus semilaevis TaxID=244447 RepID=UPI000496B5DB|nr:RING finger protein 17 [Cynoglossus semilaevis]
MDGQHIPDAVTCHNCGEAFTLPEDETEGNLPRILLCSHIFCTSCLHSIQHESVIKCPECAVETNLPEGGVFCLQEDSRIMGLIYTAKMNKTKSSQHGQAKPQQRRRSLKPTKADGNNVNVKQPVDTEKIRKVVDKALAQASENLVQLEHIHKILTTGLEEQVKREKAHLMAEIKHATEKAVTAIYKWRNMQLNQLSDLEARFSTTHMEICHVQQRIKALENAVQMTREVQRVPFLEQYCCLDKVLETLHSQVDQELFDMKCITQSAGIRCVFRSETVKQGMTLCLKMEVNDPELLFQGPSKSHMPSNISRNSLLQLAEDRSRKVVLPRPSHLSSPQRWDQRSPRADSPSSQGSSSSPNPYYKTNPSPHIRAQDVTVNECSVKRQERVRPPTGPEMANERSKFNRQKKHQLLVTQWVVVSHIVSPSHFYVRYVSEKKESEILSRKINHFSHMDTSFFTSTDTVETGSVVFIKGRSGLWLRASAVAVTRNDGVSTDKACNVTELANVRVFIQDHGFVKNITIQREVTTPESLLQAVNQQIRKVNDLVKVELMQFAPQAIRCSLNNLVPYDPTKGWSKEAQVEFRNIVGSATLEMRPLGHDRESLLVDLTKAPMDQASDVSISVREYLVFIEVARFYSPLALGKTPLQYYPPVCPSVSTEVDAVVSHINNPADFYIQLVESMEFLLLSRKLQDCYNAVTGQDDLSVYCPAIGQACVARYDDQLWYRAHVIGHPGGRKVQVQFVDFGNIKIMSVSDVKKVKNEFLALPAMAVHCCLSDVIPLEGEQTWSDKCTHRFINLAHQKLVTIVATGKISKTKPLHIQMFVNESSGQNSINKLFVTENLARFKSCSKSKQSTSSGGDAAVWDPPLEHISATEDVESVETKEKYKEILDIQQILKLSSQFTNLKVRVSHVNSPSSFYVQLLQFSSWLKRICDLVEQDCVLKEPEEVVWKTDMYCAALINGVWERGRICSDVTSTNIAEVIRCDHGNKVKLHINNLRLLPGSLVGALALECTLTDIRPAGGRSTWTATACDLISSCLTGVTAIMTIKEMTDEPPVPVTLFCSSKKGHSLSFADFLASEGVALRIRKPREPVVQEIGEAQATSPVEKTEDQSDGGEINNSNSSSTNTTHPPALDAIPFISQISLYSCPPKPYPRKMVSAEIVKTKLYDPPQLPCLSHIQIHVSAIGDNGLIYIRTQNTGRQYEQLRERIQKSMKTLPIQKPYTWKSVKGCAVIGSDMLWHRGELLELLGGHVKVRYVDCGLVENIPVVHVYPKLLCEEVPQLCIPCQLHGVNPIGGTWQPEAVALMREMLVNRSVDMVVVELPSDPRGPVTVELYLDGLSLSKILCHFKHASMDRSVQQKGQTILPPPSFLDIWDIDTEGLEDPAEPVLRTFVLPKLPEEGEHFHVSVKHLWTPNELFLWPLEGTSNVKVNGETLEDALARLNQDISSLPPLTNLIPGCPCLAEYSDLKYYRAKVMEISSVEPVTILVHHVDFGSYDTVPTSRLRQIPPALLQFPLQALKVRVSGLKAPSSNTHETVLPYSPKWSVRAMLDMIRLLENNVTTALVVSQEPELTVQLYNQDKELVYLPLVKSGLADLE